MLDIYTIIKANGGPTNLVGIAKGLRGLANPKSRTIKQLQTSLGNAVYRGFLNVDKTGDLNRWIIAPRTYYVVRHNKVRAMYAASKRKKQKHDSYIKAKKRRLIATKPKIKIAFAPKSNGLLREVDMQIASLSAQERGIHNKIDKLRKVRANIAMLEL